MKEQAIKKLRKLISDGFKKRELEEKLGMPLNSLSGILSGTKNLPDKWIEPILNFSIEGENKNTFIPKVKEVEVISTVTSWIKEIEDYCGEQGILPSDLIEAHKSSIALKIKKGDNIPKSKGNENLSPKIQNNNNSTWFSNYRKNKLGL